MFSFSWSQYNLDFYFCVSLYGCIIDDLRHISVAVIADCDFIVSWNFKHFVNVNVINKVQAVNKLLGYYEITIIPPSMLLEGDDNDD